MTCVLRLATARSDQQHSSFNNGFMLSFLKGGIFMDYHTAHQIGYGLIVVLILALVFIFLVSKNR